MMNTGNTLVGVGTETHWKQTYHNLFDTNFQTDANVCLCDQIEVETVDQSGVSVSPSIVLLHNVSGTTDEIQ